jgi:DNA-binding NarL/FixJ family response regulator
VRRVSPCGVKSGHPMTTILIADAHDVVRSGLRALLDRHKQCQVVAESVDGKEAVAQAIATAPDLAIIDYSLPTLNGVEVTRQIRQRSPGTEVIIIATHYGHPIHELVKSGALGYLLKSDAERLVLSAVATVAEHRPFFTGVIAATLLQSFLKRSDSPLTARERSVVRLIADGYSNRKIASILSISIKTVETHRAAARRKLNLRSTADLVRYVIRNHLEG